MLIGQTTAVNRTKNPD